MYPSPPDSFLQIIVQDMTNTPHMEVLCAGFEDNQWRCKRLAEHTMEWLPEFALSIDELNSVGSNNMVRLLRKAARSIYQTEKYDNRGEFGEILLHIAIRQTKQTIPVISKIYFKDSVNSTVKGFDAVHVVYDDEKLELWLGEVKFYNNFTKAMADVIKELEDHTRNNYLRNEFTAITNKIDKSLPFYEQIKKLLDINTSLDEIFKVICIPVFITYNSTVVNASCISDETYLTKIEKEVKKNQLKFKTKINALSLPKIRIHLFLLPIADKKDLISKMDTELKKWQ